MDENVGKSPDRIENAEWQSRPKLDAEGVSDDFALASAGQAMTSSPADTAKDEPDRAAPGPARDEILPRSLRLPIDGRFTCSRGRTRIVRRISHRQRR